MDQRVTQTLVEAEERAVGEDLPDDQGEEDERHDQQQHAGQPRRRKGADTPEGRHKGGVCAGPPGNGLPCLVPGRPSGSERRAPRGVWGGRPSDREETRDPQAPVVCARARPGRSWGGPGLNRPQFPAGGVYLSSG
ncbi:hypothetical protein GCM10018771_51970 [Streptomyces cellulosae]|nr:hypothetical protein GCM10018771_51970 [Streptomyces cellulosae]